MEDKNTAPKKAAASKLTADKKPTATTTNAAEKKPIATSHTAAEKKPIADTATSTEVKKRATAKAPTVSAAVGKETAAAVALEKKPINKSLIWIIVSVTLAVILIASIIIAVIYVADHVSPSDYNMGEVKEATTVRVYHPDSAVAVTQIDDGLLGEYIAEISSSSMPKVYGKIKAYDRASSLLTISSSGFYGKNKSQDIIAPFEIKEYKPLANLLADINANLTGVVELKHDYDGSALAFNPSADAGAYIKENFTGTIKGNGHKIINLNAPLFAKTTSATIESLIIEKMNLNSGENRGGRQNNAALVLVAESSTFKDVHLLNASGGTASWGNPVQGGLIARATSCTISASSVTGLNLSTFFSINGGIVGYAVSSSIEDCYASGTIGTISAGYDNITRVGGIVGQSVKSTVKNCVSEITIANNSTSPVGGLVGLLDKESFIDRSLSLSNARSAVSDTPENLTNIFAIGENELTLAAIKNSNFFSQALPFNDGIWDIAYMNKMGAPMMKGNFPAKKSFNTAVDGAYIPYYSELINAKGFDSAREQLYSNAFILAPYAESTVILDHAKKEKKEIIFNKKNIVSLLATTKGVPTSMTAESYAAADGLTVKFSDNSVERFVLKNPRLVLGGIPAYSIDGTKLTYQYPSFVAETGKEAAIYLRNTIAASDYERDLLPQVGGRDINENAFIKQNSPRVVTASDNNMLDDSFTNIKAQAESFIANLLSSTDYAIPYSVLGAEKLQETRLAADFNSLFYAYTYYNMWFNIDIGEFNLRDALFFSTSEFSDSLTLETATKAVIGAEKFLRHSNRTGEFYRTRLSAHTGIQTSGDLIDSLIKAYTGREDYNEWFKETFQGLAEDARAYSLPSAKYRVFDHLKLNSITGDNMLFPALSKTLDNSDLYIMGAPSQIAYGSLASYSEYKSEGGREIMKTRLSDYAKKLTTFYDTISSVVTDSDTLIKTISNLQLDTFLEGGNWITPPESTSPAKKYYMQAMKIASNPNGSGAYANGSIVCWIFYRFIGDVGTFTHETAHNQDGRFFLEGKGRRSGAGAESFATGMFQQGASGNSVGFNFTYDHGRDADVPFNYTTARITGKENIQSFYKNYYETMYALELLELRALLSLPKDVQSSMIYQHSFKKDENGKAIKNNSIYNPLSQDAFTKLKVSSYRDMVNNRLNITRGIGAGTVLGESHTYASANISTDYFYTPYNDETGNTDYFTFKRFGTELIGKYGYSKGFVGYTSNVAKKDGVSNDVIALKYASGDDTMTYERFQTEKYAEVENALNSKEIPYLNAEDVVQLFKDALLTDFNTKDFTNKSKSGKVKTVLLKTLMRATDEFRTSIFEPLQEKKIGSAEELISSLKENAGGNYILTADLDFSAIAGDEVALADITFTGRMNGNGYRLLNLKKPLVKKTAFATLLNVTFMNLEAPSNKLKLVAESSYSSVFFNVRNVNTSIFTAKNEIA